MDAMTTTSELRDALSRVRLEVGKAVVGQDGAVTGLLIALLANGHVLLEGVPGVAKTLLVRTLSRSLSLETRRVQFTPDLMPGDITGSVVYDPKTGEFEFREGPVFTNILLADEINRTPPKTQSALLEAMEERQVSADGVTRALPVPFLVAATQNPIEYEGTYTLPEAQLDRFLLKLVLDLPARDAEVEVLVRHASGFNPRDLEAAGVTPVLDAATLQAAQADVARMPVSADVLGYAVDLARGTRQSPSVRLGVSPRGTTALLAASRAWAWLSGAAGVTPDHIQAMALPVLRHRIQLRPEAELEGVGADAVLRAVIQQGRVPI
jgi:MoxR-like ATPase